MQIDMKTFSEALLKKNQKYYKNEYIAKKQLENIESRVRILFQNNPNAWEEFIKNRVNH
jgi:hypothetical protein